MSNTKDKILQEVKLFLKKISWRKSLAFLFFLLLSTIFWLMQVYRQKFEVTHNIPIKYTNIPDSITFVHKLPTTIHTTLKDDGAAALKYYFTKRRDSLDINVRQLVNKSESPEIVIQGEELVQLIRKKILSSTELISYSPASISYNYLVVGDKKLPVIYDGHIELAQGYIIDGELALNPEEVSVYAGHTMLDTILFAHTNSDTLRNLSSDQTVQLSLRPIEGMNFSPKTVELSIKVDKFATKEIDVPIKCKNLPPNLRIKFFPSTAKVSFIIGLKRYKNTTADDFSIEVDYNDIKKLKVLSLPIRLTKSPDYIRTQNIEPAEVEFILEQK